MTFPRSLVFLVLVAVAWVPAAADEPFPTRPITIVNPFPPGGQVDLTRRPLAAAMERILEQPVLLVNKARAAGAVGMQSVAVAKPDGYTVLITVPAMSTLPEVDKLFGRTPTFTREQFVPVARLNADPTILVVNADLPYRSVQELAVSGAARQPYFPDVPTLRELGYDVEYYLWCGLFAPKSTPPAALTVLRDAVRKAMQDPEFRAAMDKIQVPIAYQDADEFRAWWDADAARLAEVIKANGKVEAK